MTQSAPAVPVLVGYAISATTVLVSVDGPYLPLLQAGADPAGYLLYINSGDGTLRYSNGSTWIRLGTLDQISTAVATVNLGGQTLTAVANAVNPTDAVNLQTLTSYLSGLSGHEECYYATAAALPANTYGNGSSGVGATLTANADGALSVDGAAVAGGQRILVQHEAAPANNGIYTVTQPGSGTTPYILTRAADADTASNLGPGMIVPVEAPSNLTPGTANNGLVFISLAPSPFTVGSSGISFASTGQTYSADGTTISQTGTQFGLAPVANLDVLANISGAAAKPLGTSLAALLDAVLGWGQGAVLVRGASGVSYLPAGSSGQFLQTLGAGQNPQWASGTAGVVPTSGPYASLPASPVGGQEYICTDAPCRLIYQGGAWQAFYDGMLVTPYSSSGATWLNQLASTLIATGPYSYLSVPATSGNSISAVIKSYSGVTFPFKALILPNNANYPFALSGLCMSDGTKFKTFAVVGNNFNSQSNYEWWAPSLSIDNWTNDTTYNDQVQRVGHSMSAGAIWLQIAESSGDWLYQFSSDGQNWQTLAKEAVNTYLTPVYIGFCCNGIYNGATYNNYMPAAMTILSSSY